MSLKVNKTIKMFLYSGKAELSLPLGTVLGNLGLNSSKFTSDFNFFTKNLPSYFLLKVGIIINQDRSINFSVDKPTTGFLINLLKVNKLMKVYKNNKFIEELVDCITLKNLIQISLFQFPYIELKKSLPMVLGSVKSMNLYIVYD